MADILGTIVNIKDFLSIEAKEVTIDNGDGEEKKVFTLINGRKYIIPAFQREIRWSKENLNALIQDVKDRVKFLGNVILAQGETGEYLIIDGQQRLSVLIIILHYIKHVWGDEIKAAKEFKHCDLVVGSFEAFDKLLKNNFDLTKLTSEEINSDKYEQAQRYIDLWDFINEIEEFKDVETVRDFYKNLISCTINVILAKKDTTGFNIDHFIDVNLKGVRLDTEDIFKGYLFYMYNSEETLLSWVNVKQKAKKYNQKINGIVNKSKRLTTDEDETYPLIKMLYHFYYCDLFLNGAYQGMQFGTDFCLRKNYETPKGRIYYKGEHIIKIINNDAYMSSSLDYLVKILEIFEEIICADDRNENFALRFEKTDEKEKVDEDTIIIVKGLAKFLLLDTEITLPHALIMKFFLEIIKENKKITRSYCDKFFTIYAFSILFSLFVSKKEITEVETVLQAVDWHTALVDKINAYFSKGRLSHRKAIVQCKYIIDEPTGVNSHKCRALAILYNFFAFDGKTVKKIKGSSNTIKKFITDKDEYSVEHFIVNDGETFADMTTNMQYLYPTEIKKYASSIFNYIFIPDTLNGNILKNYYITDKLEILEEHLDEIKCEYSKMVIQEAKNKFSRLKDIARNGDIPQERDIKSYSTIFSDEFTLFSSGVIQNIIEKLKKSFN